MNATQAVVNQIRKTVQVSHDLTAEEVRASKCPAIHAEFQRLVGANEDLSNTLGRLTERLQHVRLPRKLEVAGDGTCAPEICLPKFGDEIRNQRRVIEGFTAQVNEILDTLEI